MNKKIFVLIPDGVGLKNFAYGTFPQIGKKLGYEIIFWNQTSKDLSENGLKQIKLKARPRAVTDLYKRAKIESELDYFTDKFNDPVYQTYKFPPSGTNLKSRIKNSFVRMLVNTHSGERGVKHLQRRMEEAERKSKYYTQCFDLLQREQPEFLFCTNQRPLTAIAPMLAARDLGVPTGCFIFSWDNLPKATKVVDADFYFVWSDHMKQELLKYYPHILAEKVIITGTPQFEVHFDRQKRLEREEFINRFRLESSRKYLCFSGDDITTSPHDEVYLEDTAQAVESLNSKGYDIGIIFRRSPVDHSSRYDKVLENHKHIITEIRPEWYKAGEAWNEILPKEEDLGLQTSIISNTFMVINLGSSMVFDYASYKKPCAFINYDPTDRKALKDVAIIYDYVHFRSMPNRNAVLWIDNKDEISGVIKKVLEEEVSSNVENALEWFKKINIQPVEKASERFWNFISNLPSRNVS
ncbi:UDP-glycosyltransferase [Gramella jeungdoensis]|uniref:UDP-glycosyltransferase n=1 Tax=Gramella jeungdoensis TaxID=708091 RepID=A0ABT0Z362_9FLAO|nr:UDP-glycosyltransferase [Gramella jeungdoensis]MCM8569219.1 UDP-glycosyltransferase [Gramella jeungdoensis]